MRPMTPWSAAAGIASDCVGQMETDGKNRSPFIKRLWMSLGLDSYYDDREPWCCAFVSWCLLAASHGRPELIGNHFICPDVASALAWCKAHAQEVPLKLARTGDVVIYLPHFSHIGIVDEVAELGVHTIEGNTDGSGGRDGDGVYRRFRPFLQIGSIWALPVRAIKA